VTDMQTILMLQLVCILHTRNIFTQSDINTLQIQT
jgi:hypothetical protein